MIQLVGTTALGLGTAGAVAATACWAVATRRDRWRSTAQGLTVAVLAAAVVAFAALVWAMVTDDFSVAYVAEHGQRAMPTGFKVLAVWSAKEGSLLLWLVILSAILVGAAITRPHAAATSLHSVAMGVAGAVTVAFFVLVAIGANPFGVVDPPPADGPGPNPLLQDHWLMAVHPPMLYAGYLSFLLPFAWAVAALVTGRTGRQWLAPVRGWTLFAWAMLTVAVVLGAWWGYQVLGWGGYWAWDPVENASILPWLTGTALLHSMVVQRRRATMRVWSLVLACATFVLVLVGTFITRSGVISSVHAFTQSTLGPILLGMIVAVVVAVALLFIWRSDRLGPDAPLGVRASREAVFVANNALLVALALIVLIGTLFPVFAELAADQRITVGAPFFNRMALPLALLLVILMGIGPVLSWGAAQPGEWRRLRVPTAVAALTAATLGLSGSGSVGAVVTFAIAAFAGTATLERFVTGASAERPHPSAWIAGARLALRRHHRFYGGLLAHLGVVMAAVAVAGSTLAQDTEQQIAVGESVSLAPYTATLSSLEEESTQRRDSLVAVLEVARNGRVLDEVETRLSRYPRGPQAVASASIVSRPRGDVYLQLTGSDDARERAGVHLAYNPLMPWLWASGVVMASGAAVAAAPWRRRSTPADPALVSDRRADP